MLGKTNVKVKPNKRINYVDYIESTGTQWIDVGVNTSNNIGVELDFQLTESVTSAQLCGGGINGEPYTMLIFRVAGGNFAWYAGGNITGPAIDLNRHVMKMNVEKQKLYIDNVLYGSPTSNIGASDKIMYLFSANYYKSTSGDSIPTSSAPMKLYSCKIYNNGELIRNFKPVQDGAGIYCLYDEVEKRYYYNQGTGEFTGGVSV